MGRFTILLNPQPACIARPHLHIEPGGWRPTIPGPIGDPLPGTTFYPLECLEENYRREFEFACKELQDWYHRVCPGYRGAQYERCSDDDGMIMLFMKAIHWCACCRALRELQRCFPPLPADPLKPDGHKGNTEYRCKQCDACRRLMREQDKNLPPGYWPWLPILFVPPSLPNPPLRPDDLIA